MFMLIVYLIYEYVYLYILHIWILRIVKSLTTIEFTHV